MKKEYDSKLIGQLRQSKLVEYVDALVREGISKSRACAMWGEKEGVNAKTVVNRYEKMKRGGERKDGRSRKGGLSDAAILGAMAHHAEIGEPLCDCQITYLAYIDRPDTSADTKRIWLHRFKKRYRDVLEKLLDADTETPLYPEIQYYKSYFGNGDKVVE